MKVIINFIYQNYMIVNLVKMLMDKLIMYIMHKVLYKKILDIK